MAILSSKLYRKLFLGVDNFDCGIMISASHNPYYDNGIKLIDCYGEKMPEETLLLVEDYIDGKIRKYIQEQEFNDQMCDQLSFKEYEDPFKNVADFDDDDSPEVPTDSMRK